MTTRVCETACSTAELLAGKVSQVGFEPTTRSVFNDVVSRAFAARNCFEVNVRKNAKRQVLVNRDRLYH